MQCEEGKGVGLEEQHHRKVHLHILELTMINLTTSKYLRRWTYFESEVFCSSPAPLRPSCPRIASRARVYHVRLKT
jgi:hypothetical protein